MGTDDTRFFTMNQLWQSIVLTAVLGGIFVFGIVFTVDRFGDTNVQALTATTSPATTTLPAAATEALPKDPFANMHLSGQAAIVVDLSSGHTLYSQNADKQLPLASLTKLLTIYEAQKVLSSGSLVTISSTSILQDGEYGFTEGETFSYSDIARLALVGSSNDAAEAIAEAASGALGTTVEGFMARAVADAGLSRTSAHNGTGLDIDLTEAGSYGSARDMAKLAGQFLTVAPTIAKATTRGSATAYSTAGIPHSLPNTNAGVASVPGIMLSKTGYTDLAGGNLVVVFDAGINHPIAVVVLGSTHEARFTDVETLMRATRESLAL